jgi:hypothetical protein
MMTSGLPVADDGAGELEQVTLDIVKRLLKRVAELMR